MIFNTPTGADSTHSEITTESIGLILEAAILDTLAPDEISAFLESHTEFNSAKREEIVTEKTIVRLDKQAKLTRAQKVAVFTVAKERNDPQFKKLLTVWRMERFLEDALMKKYGAEGMRRARASVNKSQNSKSTVVKRAANNLGRQLNRHVG